MENPENVLIKDQSSSEAQKLEPNKEEQRFDSKNLAKLEATAFGPKLTIPPRKSSSSRSKSSTSSSSTLPPVYPTSKYPKTKVGTVSDKRIRISSTSSTSDSDLLRRSQRNRKFDSPIRVENMAKRFEDLSKPAGGLKSGIMKSKWMRDDSTQSDTAFYVLDNECYSKNNNFYDD